MASSNDHRADVDRTVLPIPDRPYEGELPYDAKDPKAKFAPIEELRPPAGAPNVLIVLLDDAGFGASSAFGGPCETPTFEKLAAGGLRYNRFHTTALCAPTRAALLTGRNHHSVGMACVTELATSAPGYTSLRPNTKAPLAETLRLNGYSTAQFGKCHEVPVFQNSPLGPFDMWPTGSGFEYFYGFIGGEDNQYYPSLYEGTTPVEVDKTPEEGYHLTEDLADKAIGWIRTQKSLVPDKPFFVYFAPGATHAPHHVPQEWIDRYKGKFAHGWDRQRELTFERQKELGVIPQDAGLTKRHEEIPAWDEMDEALRPVLERQMETYAGFMSHTDHHVGRVIEAIEDLGVLEDTLIFCIIGDNGASAEGTIRGTFNELICLNGMGDVVETPEFLSARVDKWGSPEAYNHYAVGWAWAMDTPFQWTKQVASHWGGTRNGTIVHWPNGFHSRGEVRQQFFHVIDVAPTVLDAAGLPQPQLVNGIEQKPIDGVSMRYSFDDPQAPDRRTTQYFEMFCNRGIYHEGWTAVTRHSIPWVPGPLPSFEEDVWELYDTRSDWSQSHDLAAEMPEKLLELQELWLQEAKRYDVLPLDDRRIERFNAEMAGRPQLITGTSQVLYGGMGRLSEGSMIDVKNKSHAVTAEIDVAADAADGVIIAQGGAFAGWSLYARNGKPAYCYNLLGLQRFTVEGEDAIQSGRHQVRMEFDYEGGGLGKGGHITLYVDGAAVGEGDVPATVPLIFSADETADIGRDTASPVTDAYTPETSVFNGRVNWVQIDLGADHGDHLVAPEERLRVALARE